MISIQVVYWPVMINWSYQLVTVIPVAYRPTSSLVPADDMDTSIVLVGGKQHHAGRMLPGDTLTRRALTSNNHTNIIL